MRTLPKLVLDDLKRSGLTAKDAALLLLEYVPDFTPDPGKKTTVVRAVRFPYFDVNGKVVDGFSRYKLLDPYKFPKAKKPAKYIQPPNTESRLLL